MWFDFSQTASITAPTVIGENFAGILSAKILLDADINYQCTPKDDGYLLTPKFSGTVQRNSFIPEIFLCVSKDGTQTKLSLEGKPIVFVRVFIWCYIVFALLMEIAVLAIAVTSGLESVFPAFIPVLMSAFGYLLCWFGTKRAFQAVVKTIEKAVK